MFLKTLHNKVYLICYKFLQAFAWLRVKFHFNRLAREIKLEDMKVQDEKSLVFLSAKTKQNAKALFIVFCNA